MDVAESDLPRSQAPDDTTTTADVVSHTPISTAPTATVVPIIPKENTSDGNKPAANKEPNEEKSVEEPVTANEGLPATKSTAPPVFKNWADVARGSAAAKAAAAAQSAVNGTATNTDANAPTQVSGSSSALQPQTRALVEVLRSYSVDAPEKVTFIEPRGLYNSAVDCYINSVGLKY